jgi:S1-C subfamily serine protease
LVNRVLPNSPAQRAGIRRGDILLALSGRTIRNTRDLQLQVAGTPAGKTVPLEILRDGERLTVEVTIRSRDRAAVSETAGERRSLGLTLTNTENDDGIEVKDVSPRGIGAAAGIRTGDIILSLNNSRLTDLQSFDRALKEVRNNRIVRLLIKRGETTLYLAFPAADME